MTNYICPSIIIFSIILLFACSRNNQNVVSNSMDLDASPYSKVDAYAKEKYDSNYVLSYNNPKDFVLIKRFKKIRPSDLMPTVRFEIIEVSSLEMIFSDSVPEGEVEWEKEYVVKVYTNKGIPGPDGKLSNRTYRYHAKNRKKYSGGFLNNKN